MNNEKKDMDLKEALNCAYWTMKVDVMGELMQDGIEDGETRRLCIWFATRLGDFRERGPKMKKNKYVFDPKAAGHVVFVKPRTLELSQMVSIT
jgi:hypothetical protein